MAKWEKQEAYKLIEFLKDNFFDIEIRSYSGRGMYGKECLGIIPEDIFETTAQIVHDLAEKYFDGKIGFTGVDVFENCHMDNLGLKQIIYFPSIPWVEDNPDENNNE